jgi:flagellar biogenesis protein FliO
VKDCKDSMQIVNNTGTISMAILILLLVTWLIYKLMDLSQQNRVLHLRINQINAVDMSETSHVHG